MDSIVRSLLGSYEAGRLTRRQFVEGISLLAASAAVPSALAAPTPSPVPAPLVPVSVNHIAMSVADVKRSTDWYSSLFRLKVIQQNEHYALLQFGNTQLVLRSPTPERPSVVAGQLNHFMFGLAPYDEAGLNSILEARGLKPRKDLESFLIRDPDNILVQVGDERMGIDKGYPPAEQ